MNERIGAWFKRNTPDREQLAQSRWLKPLGGRVLRSDLWRFTRRSVPRGVGIGLLVGVFLMIPGLQIVGAALLCVPFRGNIPIAAAMTFLSNPATTPFILVASLYVGGWLGFRADLATFYDLYGRRAGPAEWFAWLASDAAPALVCGLLLIACVSAFVGYFASSVIWRFWQSRKWRGRAHRGGTPV